nr:MAG TPA: hypothetical protein [Caudoviricetes sp.]
MFLNQTYIIYKQLSNYNLNKLNYLLFSSKFICNIN